MVVNNEYSLAFYVSSFHIFISNFLLFQVLKWLEFAEGFPANSKDCFAALEKFNVELATKSVLLGNGLTPSAADVAVFSALHSSVVSLLLIP